MLKLIERIEALEGPDREVDAEIAKAQGWVHRSGKPWAQVVEWERPAYTASLDAAMTLVPEGFGVDLFVYPNGTANCALREWSPPCSQASAVGVTTPALALCAAALRARLQEDKA